MDSKKLNKQIIYQFLTKMTTFELEENKYVSKLISKFEEINDILNLKINSMKFIYIYKTNIHNILYEKEETININSEIMINNLSNYFYLIKLIEDNPNIVNYKYSLAFIRDANHNIKNEKNNKIRNIIKWKIIIELIKNYKQTDNYDEDEQKKELEEIEKNNLNHIKKELEELKLNLDEIKIMKIDEIYIYIINMLIITNRIDDYEYTYKIIQELDLENIDLTKTMFEELSKTLNNKEYIKNYKIIEENNIKFNEKIINFYYILFKYIIKSIIYLYNNNLLLKTRNNFLKIIKNNLKETITDNLDGNNKEKLNIYI